MMLMGAAVVPPRKAQHSTFMPVACHSQTLSILPCSPPQCIVHGCSQWFTTSWCPGSSGREHTALGLGGR